MWASHRGQARHHHRHVAAPPSGASSYQDVESSQETEDTFMANAVEIKRYVDSWSPLELDAWLAAQGLPPHVPWDPAAAPLQRSIVETRSLLCCRTSCVETRTVLVMTVTYAPARMSRPPGRSLKLRVAPSCPEASCPCWLI